MYVYFAKSQMSAGNQTSLHGVISLRKLAELSSY